MLVRQNALQLGNLHPQSTQLILNLLPLQTGQLPQAHLDDGIRLQLVKLESLHELFLGGILIAGRTDQGNDLVDEIHRPLQGFHNMRPFLGLVQVKQRPPGNDLHLELNVFLQHLLKGKHLRRPVHQRQQDCPEGDLHLGVGVQLIEHHLGNGILFQVDDHPHTFSAGVIHHVMNSLNALIVHQINDGLHQIELVHHIGYFTDDDPVAVAAFFNFRPGPHRDAPPAGSIRRPDAAATHDDAAGGKIWPLNILHNIRQLGVGTVDQQANGVHHLPQIMGRNVGRHAHRNTGGAVHQQIGKPGRQHRRLLPVIIEIGNKIHRVLVDVRQHIQTELAQPGFRIPIGGGRMSVDGAEVAVAVHQRIPQRKILGQTHHGVVHRGVAVGMIPSQHVTHGGGRLAEWLIRRQLILVHGIENPAMHRLESVPHIRQRPGYQHRHGILQKPLAHLLIQIHIYQLGQRGRLLLHPNHLPFRFTIGIKVNKLSYLFFQYASISRSNAGKSTMHRLGIRAKC